MQEPGKRNMPFWLSNEQPTGCDMTDATAKRNLVIVAAVIYLTAIVLACTANWLAG